MFEKHLATLSSVHDDEIVELVQVAMPDTTPTLELRVRPKDEAFGEMTIRRIGLAPGQIAQLRQALNLMDADAQEARTDSPRECTGHLRLIG